MSISYPVSIFFTVSKKDFKIQKQHNPENLRNRSDFCKSPQPRYKRHPKIQDVFPQHKYLSYKQCLPGCFATNSNTTVKHFPLITGTHKSVHVNITNDTECEVYAPRENNSQPSNCSGKLASKSFKQGKKS